MISSGQMPKSCVCAPARQLPASIHAPACHVQAKAVGQNHRSCHRSGFTSNKQVQGCFLDRVGSQSGCKLAAPLVVLQATHSTSCAATQESTDCHPSVRDRFMSALMACAAAASVTLALPASSAFAEQQPFLSSTGALPQLAVSCIMYAPVARQCCFLHKDMFCLHQPEGL